MSNNIPVTITYQQRYREGNSKKCLEKGRRYYEKNKERLQKMARDQYRGLSKEKKYKKRENARSIYHNMP